MKTRAIFMLTLFTAASLPLALAAQQTQTQLDEVRVSGGTGGSGGVAGGSPVASVGEGQIARQQSGSIAAALRDVAGVTLQRGDSLVNSSITLRGFGGNSVMPGNPNLQITVDGASTNAGQNYRNSGNGIVDPALIKRINVYKGPLNALQFGSGLAGGAVRAETINGADLTGDQAGFRFRQMLGAHSNGSGWVTSSTIAWQASENVDTLFNYTRRATGGQEAGRGMTVPITPVNGYNLPAYLFKTRVRFGDGHALTFSVNRSSDIDNDASFGDTSYSAGFAIGQRTRAGTTGALAYTWNPSGNDLIDLELKYAVSKQEMSFRAYQPHPTTGAPQTPAFDGPFNYDTKTLTLSNTARFQTGAVSHTLRAGLSWNREERDTPRASLAAAGVDTRVGIYALNEMDFGNDLTVTAGVRVERQKFSNLRILSGRPATLVNLPNYQHTAKTVGLGIEKGFGNGVTGFASYTVGDGLPTVDSAFYNWADTGLPIPSEMRRVRTIEAGLKYAGTNVFGTGDTLSGSFTVYQTNTRRPHQSFPAGANGALKFRGIELQAAYSNAAGFYGRVAAALVDNQQRPIASGVWEDYTYTPQSNVALTLGKAWNNGLDVSWTLNAAKGLDVNGTRYAGFGVHNIAVNYAVQSGALAGATINFGIDNIFDKGYGISPGGNIPELGRNFKLTISKTF